MTKTKEKRPGTPASVQSADPKDQLHSTTQKGEIQALCGEISDELLDEVHFSLRMAMVAANDNGNEFFRVDSLDSNSDVSLAVYGYGDAVVRNGIAIMGINNALKALEKIMERLDQIGGEPDEG